MDKLKEYIRNMNPSETSKNSPLFHGAKYLCFKNDTCIGVATWTYDSNVGDSFQTNGVSKNSGENVINVLIPDEWFLLPDKFQKKNYEKINE